MNILQAAILGLVQGLGEFLPISSSGHLLLSRILMGFTIDETGAYHMLDILLHVGTLIPVLIVFWKDWWAILKNPFKSKTLLLLFIASLPTLLFKVVFDDFITSCETGWFLGASFLLTGFFLLLAETLSAHRKQYADQPNFKHAIIMGCMQGVALLPGVSRSGSTLAGGLLSGLNRKSAAKFSFMMSAPAIVGALIIDGKTAIEEGWVQDLTGGHPRGGNQRLYRYPFHAQPHQPCQPELVRAVCGDSGCADSGTSADWLSGNGAVRHSGHVWCGDEHASVLECVTIAWAVRLWGGQPFLPLAIRGAKCYNRIDICTLAWLCCAERTIAPDANVSPADLSPARTWAADHQRRGRNAEPHPRPQREPV